MRDSLLAIASGILIACVVTGCATRREPVWYPPSESSPFIPDSARWVAGNSKSKTTCFRGAWDISRSVRKAVLAVAPRQTVALYADGRLICEAWDSHQATPSWNDLTGRLKPGKLLICAKVHCEWRPELYAQLRVEYADGSHEDFGTGEGWQWSDDPPDGWTASAEAGGEWSPVKDVGGYYQDGEAVWGREFALLPKDLLKQRFEPHNEALRKSWEKDRDGPFLIMDEPPDKPEFRDQFSGFCRIDEATGQLIDGKGRVRHLFFTIYGQQERGLNLEGWDLEQLERDLDLMEKAGVNLYIRMLGWASLLTERGEWAKLKQQPPGAEDKRFERVVDLLDYFVKRAWAHGRYIVFEGDFYWSAHGLVSPPYRTRYHIYPAVLEAQALATRKIMCRYSKCANVLGMMIGEEDIILEHDLSNPHHHKLFTDFLKRKYGTIENFKRETPWGYDYADHSKFRKAKWTAERWAGRPEIDVIEPRYEAKRNPFGGLAQWEQIPLPIWPGLLSPGDPEITLGSCQSHNQFTPEDPLWIDFYEMREDELLFNMLSRWAKIVREGMPEQLLFYSNAQDFTSSWHFLHLFKRAELPFDVIGVGCHDSDLSLTEIPAWARVRKAIKVVSSYRPYALSPGSPAMGIASGEGEGGKKEDPQDVLNYYRGALFDEIGGGAAWTQTYSWDYISGAHDGKRPHETPLLKWMSGFMPDVQGVAFPLRRPVHVLIVRNANLAHSNMSGLDFDNAMAVAEALSQLNVEFDIVMDRDLVYRATGDGANCKIDLAPYRLVIIPSVEIDLAETAFAAIDSWLNEKPGRCGRALAIGRIGNRTSRLEPKDRFHPTLQKWLGASSYDGKVRLRGKHQVAIRLGNEAISSAIDFGSVPDTGILKTGESFMEAEGNVVASRFEYGHGVVYAFGFPLGLAHEPLWGLAPQQEVGSGLVLSFDRVAEYAQVDLPIRAPHNLRVYASPDGKAVLMRERAGLKTEARVSIRIPNGISYPGVKTVRNDDGYTEFNVSLQPWDGIWLKQ
ncbi:MAG TPA: hypothetical protein PL033_06885 [Candidatus Brocadiia bacterium]|nr:hypothetical protein [Candidatus Brocadiia bacterium]